MMINRMHTILLALVLSGTVGARAAGQPNILFIFSDDHVDKAISAYQRPDGHCNKTPNIDRIAEGGAVFLRSYCANSICKPSRASVLSGAHSHINGVVSNGSVFYPDRVLFPKLLRKNGYQTAWIGKWHLIDSPADEFDYWCFNGGHGQGNYYNPDYTDISGKTETIEGYCTDITAEKVMDWIKNRDEEKPFFVSCAFKSPHTDPLPAVRCLPNFIKYAENYQVPSTYHTGPDHVPENMAGAIGGLYYREGNHSKLFPREGTYGELTKELMKDHSNGLKVFGRMTDEQRHAWHQALDDYNDVWRERKESGKATDRERKEFGCKRYAASYLACVDAVDENVGRLLDYLEAEGLAENTIVIYSSDQGYFLGEHGFTDKRKAYEPGMSMPFIIRWPGQIKPGLRHEALIQNIDYAPTFLTAAGVPVPEVMQGRPLQPLFKGETPEDWRKSVYYHYYEASQKIPYMEAVVTDRYKLMRSRTPDKDNNQWRLFDLEDRTETVNLYDNPEYAATREKLVKELAALRKQYDMPKEGLPDAVKTREERVKVVKAAMKKEKN